MLCPSHLHKFSLAKPSVSQPSGLRYLATFSGQCSPYNLQDIQSLANKKDNSLRQIAITKVFTAVEVCLPFRQQMGSPCQFPRDISARPGHVSAPKKFSTLENVRSHLQLILIDFPSDSLGSDSHASPSTRPSERVRDLVNCAVVPPCVNNSCGDFCSSVMSFFTLLFVESSMEVVLELIPIPLE